MFERKTILQKFQMDLISVQYKKRLSHQMRIFLIAMEIGKTSNRPTTMVTTNRIGYRNEILKGTCCNVLNCVQYFRWTRKKKEEGEEKWKKKKKTNPCRCLKRLYFLYAERMVNGERDYKVREARCRQTLIAFRWKFENKTYAIIISVWCKLYSYFL